MGVNPPDAIGIRKLKCGEILSVAVIIERGR
jgi:hypothetical protein